jgi:predicted lipid-binding transport protein (Tim44 family)
MTRKRVALILLAALILALVVAPAAFASAGGGSAGFSGGGGGGGGGGGSGFALFILFQLLFRIALLGHGLGLLVLVALGLMWWFATRGMPKLQEWMANRAGQRTGSKRSNSKRERRVELAAAEAAEDDPDFAPDRVRASATQLFMDIEKAWDAGDRRQMERLVSPDLLAEWDRRLDDFDRRGWRNRVEPLGEPAIEYVGLNHTGDAATDHVVVRIDARVKDYVVDRFGRHIKRTGSFSEVTRIREFWTLQKRNHRWILASIEQGAEGKHALQDEIVASAYSDETSMRDEALIEGAVADQVPDGVKVAEVADLQYEGDARAAAMDLSLADGRFAPDVLEVAARRAVAAWAQAVDGDDALLDSVATRAAKRELLYAGDTSGTVRMVVRGPKVNRIRIMSLDAAAEPPTMTLEVDITGNRYVENRDTTAVLAGSRTRRTSFTERWTLAVTGDDRQPWRIVSASAPVGLA